MAHGKNTNTRLPGDKLFRGESLVSENGEFRLQLEPAPAAK
jgi:hypothetical protein